MQMIKAPQLKVFAFASGLIIAFLALHLFWTGDRTIYLSNCQQRIVLIHSLINAKIPFAFESDGGINVGRISDELLKSRLGIENFLAIKPDTNFACK
jgi:hypothetical protein